MLVVTTVRPGIFSGAAHVTFADQEGGLVQAVRGAPTASAATYRTVAGAFAGGRATARALRRAGVGVDFAPVFDTADGPLGSRQFVRSELAVSFARGLARRACAKHFPGLGSAAISTDERPHVEARIRPRDLAPYRTAIRAGLECVMVNNAFYGGARYRASLEPRTYRLLRRLGFDGIAVTDSLSLVRSAPVERWAPQAIRRAPTWFSSRAKHMRDGLCARCCRSPAAASSTSTCAESSASAPHCGDVREKDATARRPTTGVRASTRRATQEV